MKKLKIFLRKLIGQKYVANPHTLEIHKLKTLHHNCHIEYIQNKIYLTNAGHIDYLYNGYNGCRWCNQAEDLD